MEAISTKEIAEAVLAASAAITSLLLVFIGFLFSKADSIPAGVAVSRTERYVRYARMGIIPVFVSALVMLSSYGWLFYPASTILFYSWSIGFVVEIVLLVAYALLAVLEG